MNAARSHSQLNTVTLQWRGVTAGREGADNDIKFVNDCNRSLIFPFSSKIHAKHMRVVNETTKSLFSTEILRQPKHLCREWIF